MKIVITPRGFAKCGLDNVEIIEKEGFSVEYNSSGNAYTKEEFYEKTADADGIVVGVEKVDKDYIDSHPKLKAVVKFGVGTDNIDLAYCKEKGIFVGRTPGSNARSVAETAMCFVFADSKNLYESISETRANRWTKLTGMEIGGKTIGIVGFGAIGKQVAQMAHAMGMKVLVYEPYHCDEELLAALGAEKMNLDELLKQSDYVSLHLPLTAETENLIAAKQMRVMKSTAVLINTARGGIVNEADLAEILREKTIRAAYFDVLTNEPPKEDEPLLGLDNFYLTPHVASRSREAEKKTADMATQVVIEALKKV